MMRRKQFDALKKLSLAPEEWCGVLGLVMYDRDGWRIDGADYAEPIALADFYARALRSTMGFEDDATEFFDVENYLAEDEAAPE